MNSAVNSAYKNDGFYVARGLLDKAMVDAVLASIHRTILDQLSVLRIESQENLDEDIKMLFNSDIERYMKVLGALYRKLDVLCFLQEQSITGFLQQSFGWGDIFASGGQVVHVQSESLKIPGGYFGVGPHQDFHSVQGSLDGVVVWIPLVDIDRSMYPLEVLPGSHRQGLLPSIENPGSTPLVKPEVYREQDFVPVVVERGDVVFISYFTVHRSGAGEFSNVRFACSTRYDNASEPTFRQRGYPSAYRRSVNREPMHDIDQELMIKQFL